MNLLLAVLLCLQDPAPKPAEKPKPQPQDGSQEVVVTADRRETDIMDVPAGMTVITGRQIKESGATNMVEVIERQPGFFAQGQVKGAYDRLMDLRGYNNGTGNGQRTLVLVDGRKTNSVTGSTTDWAAIPLDNIDRIEIVRGPSAAIYGDTAMAGVINIITKKGSKDPAARLTLSGGTWSTFNAGVVASASSEKATFQVLAQDERTKGYRRNSGYRGDTITTRMDYDLDPSLRFFAKLGHHDDDRERPGSLTQGEMAVVGRRGSVRRGNAHVAENYIDAGAEKDFGDYGELSVTVDHTRTDENSFDQEFQFNLDDGSQLSSIQLKHVLAPKKLPLGLTFTTGMDFSYETADAKSALPGFNTETGYVRRLMGLYEQVELRPVEMVIVTAGARFDRALFGLDREDNFGTDLDVTKPFDQWSPQAGVTVRPTEWVSIFASAGRSFKYPTRDEFVGFTAFDPELLPERATTYQGGFRVLAKNVASGEVTVYRMIVHDEIFFDPTFFGPFGSNVNFEKVTHSGVETQGRVTPFPWLDLFATYTFTRVVINNALDPAQIGKTYPVTPRHAASLGATGRYEGAVLTVDARFAGHRFLISDFTNSLPTLEDYVVYDAKISYTWRMLTGFVSVYNFTDRKYFDSGGANGRFNPAPERSVLVGAEAQF
ncbi:MAG TPA: TonB-dependent receptor [Planctomycetota bacterium]|nr:TonB-dependent receptor [Planctomycetota bacterium]